MKRLLIIIVFLLVGDLFAQPVTSYVWRAEFLDSMLVKAGKYESFQAGENISKGDICYYKPADSKMWLANGDATATSSGLIMAATATIASQAYGNFSTQVTLNGFTGLTAADPVYLSVTVDGGIVHTAPSTVGHTTVRLGDVKNATTIRFDIDETKVVK